MDAILTRWQYAGIQWGPAAGGAPVPPAGALAGPPGFMALGFPGVFVGVGEAVLGELRDTRAGPPAPRPSQEYLLTLPSLTLKDMWRTAITKQREALTASEGEGAPLHRVLRDELRTAEKFDEGKSDRQWGKKLRAAGGSPPRGEGGEEAPKGAAVVAAAAAAAAHKASRVVDDE